MKSVFMNNIPLLFFFLFASAAYSQSDDAKPRYEAHWAGIDMGVSILTNEEMGMEFSENVTRYQTTLNFLNSRITGLMSAIRGE